MANYYPVAMSYHFRVEVDGISSDGNQAYIHCQSVSGLTLGNEKTFDVVEGGENTFTHHLPERLSFAPITIKRAMVTESSEFMRWVISAVQEFDYSPKTMRVVLLNEKHEPLKYWTFVNAYPLSLAVSDFDAQKGEVVTETIKFAYQFFTRS